jgi:hypothetical protein
MRKLIVSNIMSLDGYFEGPGQDVMALPMGRPHPHRRPDLRLHPLR